ncbi:aldehyde reductase [Mucilaginibacter sp. CAU 1740]|uniref:SDR family oxidoreductase n=1 Tax=Mucilaginibacter sp. CAU 1740 TaxID=3140365 RepID=UPI00325AC51D
MKKQEETVLVTGGSGFLAGYCILQLLEAGYLVRTTIRSLDRQKDVLMRLGAVNTCHMERLSFTEADLLTDDHWNEAAAGCSYVLHVASPFPDSEPKDENDLIVPAREGTLRVLNAAHRAGVKRVVLTSSFAAIGYSTDPESHLFTESDWTDNKVKLPAYIRSKTVAEQAAWDFIRRTGGDTELAVINPVGIFGPVLAENFPGSVRIIERMMSGAMPALPDLYTNLVDVRDVADLHIRAMLAPEANGERFIALSGGNMSFKEIAQTIKSHIPEIAERIPVKVSPSWILRILSLFKPELRPLLPNLGIIRNASNEKARIMLDWSPRPNQELIVDTAKSLLEKNIIKI